METGSCIFTLSWCCSDLAWSLRPQAPASFLQYITRTVGRTHSFSYNFVHYVMKSASTGFFSIQQHINLSLQPSPLVIFGCKEPFAAKSTTEVLVSSHSVLSLQLLPLRHPLCIAPWQQTSPNPLIFLQFSCLFTLFFLSFMELKMPRSKQNLNFVEICKIRGNFTSPSSPHPRKKTKEAA